LPLSAALPPSEAADIEPLRIEPWRRFVGANFGPMGESLDDDSVNGFRWLLLCDRDMGASEIRVDSVRLILRID